MVVNDLHIGSDVGIMPNNVRLDNGNRVKSNGIQKYLFDRWKDMCNTHDIDVCICNGDLCDGENKAENGKGLWTTDADIQASTAAELLAMIDADVYHGTAGSEYHTGRHENRDKMTMTELGGTFDDEAIFTYSGVRIHARHKTGFTSVPYTRSNPLNKDMVNTVLEYEEYGNIDIFLRAHTHYSHAVLWKSKLGIINPCWKYKDAYIRKQQNVGCDIGYTVLDCKDGDYEFKVHDLKMPQDFGQTISEYGIKKKNRRYDRIVCGGNK